MPLSGRPGDNEGTSHSELKPRFKLTPSRLVAGFSTLAFMALLTGGLMSSPPHRSNNHNPTNPAQPTSNGTTPPTTQPRAFARREARILDRRGLSVDTSSESYPKLRLDGVADSVVGHSEARSILDNNDQKM